MSPSLRGSTQHSTDPGQGPACQTKFSDRPGAVELSRNLAGLVAFRRLPRGSSSQPSKAAPYFLSLGLSAERAPFLQPTTARSQCRHDAEPIPQGGQLVKRVLDLLLSSMALLVLWPAMLAIALAIKLESRGPAVYRSFRAGKWGRKFVCYKFRTMVEGADELKGNLRSMNERHGPFFKIADDPRATRLGKFLRRYSLDELLQFWNVLKGEMTLVGPRPHPLDDVALYSPEHFRRLDVKPGLTGLWQVTARAIPSFETCMALDLRYIRGWNVLLDCKILLQTIPAVLAGEGQ